MVLGFISLLLTFGQNYIAKVCIPSKYENTMLPCPYRGSTTAPKSSHGGEPEDHDEETTDHHRRLLWYEHRHLAGGGPVEGCKPVSYAFYLVSQFFTFPELKRQFVNDRSLTTPVIT